MDGIITLLNIPDVTEKRLALKSKAIQPYHLRHALSDSDPTIRAEVANHPKLTPELKKEILTGDDKDLKHIVLKRPDITEEDLKLVATDPHHALEVARHGKTTDTIRNMALEHPSVPKGVKEVHSSKLSKSIGHITYPLLNEGKVYTKPMQIKSGVEAEIRNQYVSGQKNPPKLPPKMQGLMMANYRDTTPVEPHLRQISGFVKKPETPASSQTSQRLAPLGMTPHETYKAASKIDSGKTMQAIEDHEAQHSVFSRIAQKHGNEAANRVVAVTLSKLPQHHREHIKNLFSASGAISGDPTVDPEETIAYLHNYLQDPNRRNKIHSKLGYHTREEQRNSMEQARQAWNGLRRIGMSLTPEEVGINPKDETNRMARWVKKLSKRESIPSDQLGFSVSFHELIAIAQFLTQQEVGMDVIRQALRDNDGDPVKAVQVAYGLNTTEGQKAFDNVKLLKLHKTEDFLKEPKSIVCSDSPDMAIAVKKAYKNNEVEPIALGGKHSSGSYILKDESGDNWLLKPGSGKKSPAAGVDETQGSQSRREVAFSGVAQWLGVSEVMPAHLLNVDGKEVAVIKMWPMDWTNLHRSLYEDPSTPRRALDRYLKNGKLFQWSVLDFITGSVDRHGNNLMVSPEDEGNKIGLIDHGSSFAGYSFNPGHDQDSFVPYYLRVWSGPGFHNMDYSEQIKQMPVITGELDESLRTWIEGLSEKDLESVVSKYGMDPGPPVARLKKVKDLVASSESASLATNAVWLAEPIKP